MVFVNSFLRIFSDYFDLAEGMLVFSLVFVCFLLRELFLIVLAYSGILLTKTIIKTLLPYASTTKIHIQCYFNKIPKKTHNKSTPLMQVNFAKYLDFFRKKQYHWYCTIFASVLTIR